MLPLPPRPTRRRIRRGSSRIASELVRVALGPVGDLLVALVERAREVLELLPGDDNDDETPERKDNDT